MKFKDFVNLYSKYSLVDSRTFSVYSEKPQHLRRQVREWAQKGYLLPLKRGLYLFSEDYQRNKISPLFIANYMCVPSYISLGYALYYYNLIPEKVTVFTSLTTKKTMVYDNYLARFEYRSIKKDLFFGFKEIKDEDFSIFISLPEKAILDFFYFNTDIKGSFDYFDSLRLQNLEILNIDRFNLFQKKYSKRVQRIADLFVDYVEFYNKKYKKL